MWPAMLIDAAIEGRGIALVRVQTVGFGLKLSWRREAWDRLRGRLVLPHPCLAPLDMRHWILYPKMAPHDPQVIMIRDWLLAEAPKSAPPHAPSQNCRPADIVAAMTT